MLARVLARLGTSAPATDASIAPLLPRFDETGHWADGVPPLTSAERISAEVVVGRCLDRVPEPFRTVLVLCDVEELGADDAARLLGTTPALVRRRLHQARQALQTLVARAIATPGDRADPTRA